MDRTGIEAFERAVRAHFDKEAASKSHSTYARDRWGGMLKAVYAHQRSIAKYLDLAERVGIKQADCEAIAT